MLGLRKGMVGLLPHAEVWHQLFAAEEAQLRAAIGEHVVGIEHVGSTSICGLSAKPIIDVAVAVREIADAGKCIAPLENIGYIFRGEMGIPGRRYFVKGEPRTHHLHMVEARSDVWKNHLLFRDYLRQHAEVAAQYETLKKQLAHQYAEDRAAYTEGKAAFIRAVLKAASK